MRWLRLYHDTINDPKWRVVALESGQPLSAVLAVWMSMLINASDSDERGTLHDWNDRIAGAAIDLRADAVQSIREAMQGLVLDGFRLTGWDKRQRASDDVAARVQRHRSRTKETPPGGGSSNGSGAYRNGAEARGNGDVTLQKRGETEKPLESVTLLPTPTLMNHGGGDAGARAHAAEVGQEVAALAAMPKHKISVAKVGQWLANGFNPQLDIYPAVLEVTATVRGPVNSFNCFDAAISRHHIARTAPKDLSNVHPFPPAKHGYRHSGRATGSAAACRVLARELAKGDPDTGDSGLWEG